MWDVVIRGGFVVVRGWGMVVCRGSLSSVCEMWPSVGVFVVVRAWAWSYIDEGSLSVGAGLSSLAVDVACPACHVSGGGVWLAPPPWPLFVSVVAVFVVVVVVVIVVVFVVVVVVVVVVGVVVVVVRVVTDL